MPAGRAFLDRLRPVGSPGAAARRGVPADRLTEIEAELEPLFGLLAEIDAEAKRVRDEARDEASRIVRDGQARAEALVADARSRAEAARARAAAAGRSAAAAEEVTLRRAGDEDIDVLRARARTRMGPVVESAVASARAELRELAGEANEPSDQHASTP